MVPSSRRVSYRTRATTALRGAGKEGIGVSRTRSGGVAIVCGSCKRTVLRTFPMRMHTAPCPQNGAEDCGCPTVDTEVIVGGSIPEGHPMSLGEVGSSSRPSITWMPSHDGLPNRIECKCREVWPVASEDLPDWPAGPEGAVFELRRSAASATTFVRVS